MKVSDFFEINSDADKDGNLLIKISAISERKLDFEEILELTVIISEQLLIVISDNAEVDLWNILDKKLRDIESFSSKMKASFKKNKLIYLGELVQCDSDTLKRKGFGETNRKKMKNILKGRDLSFDMDNEKELGNWIIPTER